MAKLKLQAIAATILVLEPAVYLFITAAWS